MDISKMFLGFMPAISAIFQLGFIPSKDEIHELSYEQYAAYQAQSGDVSKQLYTVVPKSYKYLTAHNEVDLLTKDNVDDLMKASVFLRNYAIKNGCKSDQSDNILKYAAERLPATFTEGTRFERPQLKVVNSNERMLSDKEEWINLLADMLGGGETLNVRATRKDTNIVEEKFIPVKKQ